MLTLKPSHTPVNGLHFWTALCLASILGCNTGDGFASFFGFLSGLPALVIAFAVVMLVERRDTGSTKAYYWLAILLVRTAATNLADFVAKQNGLVNSLFSLTALLLVVMLFARVRRRAAPAASVNGLPVVDGLYWGTMLVAGTLGTALGDYASFKSGLGLEGASLALSVLVAVLIALKVVRGGTVPLSYWLVVVMIRTAGTSVGDMFAHHIGLWQSTLLFAVLLVAFLGFRPRPGPASVAG